MSVAMSALRLPRPMAVAAICDMPAGIGFATVPGAGKVGMPPAPGSRPAAVAGAAMTPAPRGAATAARKAAKPRSGDDDDPAAVPAGEPTASSGITAAARLRLGSRNVTRQVQQSSGQSKRRHKILKNMDFWRRPELRRPGRAGVRAADGNSCRVSRSVLPGRSGGTATKRSAGINCRWRQDLPEPPAKPAVIEGG